MKIKFEKILSDYLALIGESPDLLPELGEGEESAVLTLERELEVKLPAAALQASLEIPRHLHEEIKRTEAKPEKEPTAEAPWATFRLPADFLKLHSLKLADWKEPVSRIEPEESLRATLGANAPGWMVCAENPMLRLDCDPEGMTLKAYGSSKSALGGELLYVPVPRLENGELTISRAAYGRMLGILKGRIVNAGS